MRGSVGAIGWGGAAKTRCWVGPKEELVGILTTQYMVQCVHQRRRGEMWMENRPISLCPIGHVVNGITQLGGVRWEQVESRIVIDEAFAPGLDGLDGFSHVLVLSFLHKRDRPVPADLHLRPEGDPDMPLLGVFATRTPKRPNPLAVTAVRLLRLEGNELLVRGLDVIDGTPVLDVKPYLRNGDLIADATAPDWIQRMWNRAREGQA